MMCIPNGRDGLHQLNVQRSFKPANFGKVVTKQLHSMPSMKRDRYTVRSSLERLDYTTKDGEHPSTNGIGTSS